MTSLFRLNQVSRRYRTPDRDVLALDSVELTLQPGQRLGVVGESGSGKSTLARIMAALDRPTSGEVWFKDQLISSLPQRELGFLRAEVQMVFQDPRSSLNPRRRVGAIVSEPLRSLRLRGQLSASINIPERTQEVLAEVGLPATAADRYPHEFSGGQRQRIAIARALAPRPSVLIADEPVSALDVSVRAQVINLLNDLARAAELTMVVVTHDLLVVRHLCDRLAVMQAGKIVEQGPTEQIYSSPQHPYTKALLAAIPRLA